MPTPKSEPSKYNQIRLHYEIIKDDLTWTAARFRRLAAAMKLTTRELGAFIRLPGAVTNRYMKDDAFPTTVELHLTIIERAVLPSSRPQIFPAL
jgi:hypothetical protein